MLNMTMQCFQVYIGKEVKLLALYYLFFVYREGVLGLPAQPRLVGLVTPTSILV